MRSPDGFSARAFEREEMDWSDRDEASQGFSRAEMRAAGINPDYDEWHIVYDKDGHGKPVKGIAPCKLLLAQPEPQFIMRDAA